MPRPKADVTIVVRCGGITAFRLNLVKMLVPGEWQVWRDGKLGRKPFLTTTAICSLLRRWLCRL